MALHELIQRLLLLGLRLPAPPPPPREPPPQQLAALVQAVQAEHQTLNAAAIAHGQRYRSAYWALYLRSALAVLLAVLPVGLGWADPAHPLHRYALLWGIAEMAVILTVVLLYQRGVHADWKGRWLQTRAQAEMVWYLPLLAALRAARGTPPAGDDWYAEVFAGSSGSAAVGGPLPALCRRLDGPARDALRGAWQDAEFLRQFGRWTAALLAGQCHYHRRTGQHHAALQRRVHQVTAALFLLTALAAALHLVWHAPGLLIITTACPALGAALHAALVQSEAQRLSEAARRIERQLERLGLEIEAVLAKQPLADDAAQRLYSAAYAALAAILDEHETWHLLVRPHQLPLG